MYKIIGGDQREYGPATADEIRQWVAEGRLNGQSQIRADTGEWRALETYPEFASSLERQRAPATAPPGAAPPADLARWGAQITESSRSFSIGSCFSRAGRLVAANFGVLFGATLMVWLIGVVMQFLPLVGVIYWLLRGVLYGGLYVVYLKVIRGQPTSVQEMFTGFGPGFSQLMLVGIVSSLLSGVGLLFCVLPWVYLVIAWIFCVPLVADKRLEFWSAMELSRNVVNRVWFKVFLLALLAFLPLVVVSVYTEVKITSAMWASVKTLFTGSAPFDPGRIMEVANKAMMNVARMSLSLVLLTKLVLLLNLPFGVGALMYAYEDLFGTRPAPAA